MTPVEDDNPSQSQTACEKSIWTKVVSSLTKGRIYGLGSEALTLISKGYARSNLDAYGTNDTMQYMIQRIGAN